MTCTESREAMMIADAAELRGLPGTTALAQHLESCRECNARARVIGGNADTLANAMNELVRKDAANAAAPTSHTDVVPLRPRYRARWYATAAAAVIACVAIGGVITRRAGEERAAVIHPLPVPARATISMPEVNAKAAGDVAVIRTGNPSITVIWYLSPRRGKS